MADVAEIAESLDEQQRRDILEQPTRAWSTGSAIMLARQGFFNISEPRWLGDLGEFTLTPIGLAVRDYLANQQESV